MDINTGYLKEGARNAKGLCVVIDVFRACTVQCYAANKEPKEIIISNDIGQIRNLKKKLKDAYFIGKNHKADDIVFNTSNSPYEISNMDLYNKTIIHYSEGGISGLLEARQADEIITGSFVNAEAVAKYITSRQYKLVNLVCMGFLGEQRSEEDDLCAEYIKSIICNENLNTDRIAKRLKETTGKYFFQGDVNLPERDFYYCLDFNKFNFVLAKEKINDKFILNKIEV